MTLRQSRPATGLVALALVLGWPALAGCGLIGGGSDQPPAVDESPQKARDRVQAYLDAMRAKDVQGGRAQLCVPLHESFDAAATGPNGDFAEHFEVTEAAITDIRAADAGQQVSTALTVTAAGKPIEVRLLFTVTPAGDGTDTWCIADETVGGNAATPSGGPTPEPDLTP